MKRSVRGALRRAASGLVAVGMLTALLALSSPAEAGLHSTDAQKSRIGACYQERYRSATQSYRGVVVPCSERHNAITIAEPTAPDSVAKLSEPEIAKLAADTCEPLALKRLGRTAVRRATSAYRFFFWHPTAVEYQAGLRWFHCDIVLGAGDRLLPLPPRLPRPILSKRPDERTELCLTERHLMTTCAHKHAYRPLTAVKVRPMSYPTQVQRQLLAHDVCPPTTRWILVVPPLRWQYGDRVLTCFAKTHT